MLANFSHREIYVWRMRRKNSYNGAVRHGCDGHVFYSAWRCAPGFSRTCETMSMGEDRVCSIVRKYWHRIIIAIVSHCQTTNIAIYHWWSSFVCGYWVLTRCWKMDSWWNFVNFTYLSSLYICQSYGLTASSKHRRITLKMHCIRLTCKWHVGLKPI